jgi:hypothetical protein
LLAGSLETLLEYLERQHTSMNEPVRQRAHHFFRIAEIKAGARVDPVLR